MDKYNRYLHNLFYYNNSVRGFSIKLKELEIEYDEASERTPLIIIDGKPYTWEEVGKMIMSYEGFQIMIKRIEFTEDVEEGEL